MAAAHSICTSFFTAFCQTHTKFQGTETRRVIGGGLINPLTSRTEKKHLMLKHSGGDMISSARSSSCSILCDSDATRTWRIASTASPEMREQKWIQEGVITESLRNGMFRVRLDNEDMVIGYISGKIRSKFIKILLGDKVKIEMSRYDSTKGRIVFRLKSKDPKY